MNSWTTLKSVGGFLTSDTEVPRLPDRLPFFGRQCHVSPNTTFEMFVSYGTIESPSRIARTIHPSPFSVLLKGLLFSTWTQNLKAIFKRDWSGSTTVFENLYYIGTPSTDSSTRNDKSTETYTKRIRDLTGKGAKETSWPEIIRGKGTRTDIIHKLFVNKTTHETFIRYFD